MAMKKDFGAFEIHEKIGSGGMASVYLGVQKSLDRKVVLKILYPHLAEDEKLVTRFEREARAAAMLRHENIVQVIDCGRYDEVAYIAMEFVEGMDLKKWMETYGPPPLEVGLLLLRDLCSGLEHAHQHRIVHRDIKPANIMLTPDGMLKIMDFGLARRGEDSTAVTVVGSVLGTPAYMSPEQATGEAVDERSDIFSAGVVGYELLGGQRPFQGDSYSTVLRSVLTVEPPSLTSFNPLVPDEVVAIIHRMIQKDVSKRYPRIAQVRSELDSALEQVGIHRGRDLLREYAQDPRAMMETLRKKRLARHLDLGIHFETMGLGKIDDALLEFRRVLHLDPENKTAREHVAKLERERTRAERATVRDVPAAGGAEAPAAAPAPVGGTGTPASPAPATTAKAAPPPKPAEAKPAAQKPPPAPKPVAAKPAGAHRPASDAQKARTMLIAAAASLLVVLIAVPVVIMMGRGSSTKTSNPPPEQVETPAPVAVAPAPADTAGTEIPPPPAAALPGLATIRVATEPGEATVSVDDSAPQNSPATFSNLSEGRHRVRASRAGFVTAERTLRLSAGRDTLLKLTLKPEVGGAAASAAAGAPHELRVETEPAGAGVSLDDGPVQLSPARFKPVAAGRHTVRITMQGFTPVEHPFGYSAQRDTSIRIALAASPGGAAAAAAVGWLALKAIPAGDFFVDKELKVSNRDTAHIALSPGNHKVEIRNPQLFGAARKNEVRIESGRVKALWVDFREDVGFLRVTTSDGSPAVVILNGNNRLPNPAPRVFPVKPGAYNVRLAAEAGRSTVEGMVQKKIAARETVSVHFTWKAP